jgi:uncharacterized protein DUF6471
VACATIVNDKSNVYSGNRHRRRGASVKTEDEWADDVKRLLRAEMTRRGVTYDQLAEKLAEIGVADSSVNIRNKVARGKFTAVFLVQCLEAMGCRSLRLSDPEGGQ